MEVIVSSTCTIPTTVAGQLEQLGIRPMSPDVVKHQQRRLSRLYRKAYLIVFVAAWLLLVASILGGVFGAAPLPLMIPLAVVSLIIIVGGFWGFQNFRNHLEWHNIIAVNYHGRMPAAIKTLANRLTNEFGVDNVRVEFAQTDPYLYVRDPKVWDPKTRGRHYVAHWIGRRVLYNGAATPTPAESNPS
jgi:hypothetical protein